MWLHIYMWKYSLTLFLLLFISSILCYPVSPGSEEVEAGTAKSVWIFFFRQTEPYVSDAMSNPPNLHIDAGSVIHLYHVNTPQLVHYKS